jgi:hypothetical protein
MAAYLVDSIYLLPHIDFSLHIWLAHYFSKDLLLVFAVVLGWIYLKTRLAKLLSEQFWFVYISTISSGHGIILFDIFMLHFYFFKEVISQSGVDTWRDFVFGSLSMSHAKLVNQLAVV